MHAQLLSNQKTPFLDRPDAWEDPIFFDESATPEIPFDLLPDIFGAFAKNLSESMETPEALAVMTILGVISTLAAKHFFVSPKEGWHEPVNIYTLVALPPANHKSIILKYCTQPLIEWEKEQVLMQGQKIKQQISEHKTQEKIIESLRFKAAKLDDISEQQKLIHQIAEKETALKDIPVLPQLFVNDVTPESLITLLHEQQGRLAIFSDEGGLLETLSGLYSHGMANIDILLKGIDGGEVRVRRKDKSLILNPYLSIVLAVQPAILHSLAQKQTYQGNGTLERFLYVMPKSKLGYRTHDKPALSTALQLEYHQAVKKMLNAFSLIKNKLILRLSPEALQAWQAFQQDIEMKLRPNQTLFQCQGWGGKICGYTLRLAGILHIAEHHDYVLQNSSISLKTMGNAIHLAQLLIDHAIAAFGYMDRDQHLENAKEIFEWVKKQPHHYFRQSDLLIAMRNRKNGRAENIKKTLQLLIDRNLINGPVKQPTRKPTTIFFIHPSVQKFVT